jgi:hypothetical protein
MASSRIVARRGTTGGRMPKQGAVLAALLLALSSPSAAQQPAAPESLAAARARAVAQLYPRDRVRLAISGAGVVEGRFLGVSGDSLHFTGSGGPRSVPLAAVDGLWTRGRRTVLGAVVGGTVLGVADGFLFYAIGMMFCGIGGSENCHPWTLALVGGAGGAVGGALLGSAIGTAFTRWARRFP